MHRLAGLLALALAAALLGGCAERTHTDKTVIEWSRGKQVGLTNASEPVAIPLDAGSGRTALAFSGEEALAKLAAASDCNGWSPAGGCTRC